MHDNKDQIIFTHEARCLDCYRCVRACPVNAIQMKDGQASVDKNRCILCGTCIRECPQNAKAYRNDLELVKTLIKKTNNSAVSLAPSFAALFNEWERKRIPSLFRKLGFNYVSETAEGAYYVAKESAKVISEADDDKALIASACPSLVNYIEKYRPEHIPNLVRVVSPMIAHALILKKKLGYDSKVVFVGPCIAKKGEAEREEYAGFVDAVLTFDELKEWIEEEGIDFKMLEESDFDDVPLGKSRTFPLVGGLTKTALLNTDLLADDTLSVSGFEEITEALNAAEITNEKLIIEPLICATGCGNGPGITTETDLFTRRKNILDYSNNVNESDEEVEELKVNLVTDFKEVSVERGEEFTEEEIREVLEQTGNSDEKEQLNCGACGYSTCVEKAKAVLMGMAEKEMCIPYMRRMAEQRTDKIIQSSPNGIVILDGQLDIIHMNPAFQKFFMCTNSVLGKRISYLMDPEPFIDLMNGEKDKLEVTIRHNNYNIVCHQILYKLIEDEQYVGIFVNITKNLADSAKLDDLKLKTIDQAQELMNHQIDMAQQLAKLLGEYTAKGEALVDNLLKFTEDKTKERKSGDKNWLWDIYTSK